MKILRIRGQNLASLEAPFDVDLAGDPLGRAGLFAITGPTGAGKSTLLDAVCLCLYDRTPRFSERGGAAVLLSGQDTEGALLANDQRNILRRGAGEAWAEVQFRGRDGRVWTARWEVRRARKRADGKVQTQQVLLQDDQGRAVGGTRTETLDAIQARIGLDFDQFRRSVLLAQGDFAAFLRAGENERAELLEQMTGTAIYTRLSQAAFQQRREFEARQRELELHLDAAGVLGDVERAAAQAALDQARTARDQATAAVRQGEDAVRWHARQAELEAALALAQAQQESAQAAWQAADGRRVGLARAEQGWALRGQAREAEQARARAAAAQAEQAAAEGQDRAAQQQRRRAQAAVAQARAELARAREALCAQVQGRLETARGARQVEADWLEAHPAHKGLAEAAVVEGIERALAGYTRSAAAAQAAEATLAGLQAQVEARAEAATRTGLARQEAEAQHRQQESAVEAARRSQAAHDDDALLRQRRELDLRTRALAELERLDERARALAAARDQAALDADRARAGLERATAEGASAESTLATLDPRLEEARLALQRARAALDAQGLRATLEPGQPCPVCGSPEHPWAQGSPLAALHDEQQARVQALEAERRGLDAALARARALARAGQDERDRALATHGRARVELAALAAPWAEQAIAAGSAGLPGPEGAAPALATRREALSAEGREQAGQELAARDARRTLETARKALEVATTRARAATEAATTAERALDQARAEQAAARDRLADERARLTERAAELALLLDPLLPEVEGLAGWRERLDPAGGLLPACRSAAAEWGRRVQRRQAAQAAVDELGARLPRDCERRDAALAGALAEDLALARPPAPPAGLAPPELSAWLDAQDRQATARVQALADEAGQAEAQAQDAGRRSAAAGARATALAEQAQAATTDLQRQALALGMDEGGFAALLALPEDWLPREKAALLELEQAPARAATLQAERLERLQEHAATRPAVDAPAAQEVLGQAREALAAADLAWSAAQATLLQDDAARARATDLGRELDAHALRAAPWLALAACIGSGSGVEFKRFAQSLTLEVLLEQANEHLRALHPRYSLARIHGTDLDLLVIDHDLGDEPRTVQSLSGGEAFLASLALALGLSSLSARDVRVESLFIDEGFGTLDARTLDTALAVLDGLQAAGRQVGVISHVGGMAERIGVQVKVEPQGGGRSTVTISAG